LFAHEKIMEQLQSTYSKQRTDYASALKQAIAEKDPEKMTEYSKTLINMNQAMSATVSSMVQLVAVTESKVNLDSLRDKLLAELVDIQKDIKNLQASYGERKVLKSMYDQYSFQNTRSDWTVMAYLIALGIGILLVVSLVLKNTFINPAELPTAIPLLSSSPNTLL